VIANQEVIDLLSNMTAISSLAPGGIGPVIVRQLIEEKMLLPLCHDVILPFYQKRSARAIQLVQDSIDDARLHIHKPEGALFLWLWFEGLSITSSELYMRLKKKGLLVVAGEYFFPGQPEPTRHAESCIRLSYAQSDEDLIKGVDILARELKSCWA
jgi:valine--pyruvate aminotransferase